MKLKTKIIGNKVHDIGYRVFLLRKALELGVERFNAYNTTEKGNQVVIALLEGSDEQITAFKDFARLNRSENAEVLDIILEDYEGYVMSVSDYMHLIQVEQLSKGIPAILSIDKKQDKMLEKLDETKKEVVGEIRDLRWDVRSYMDKRLVKIENDIAQIKAKMDMN